MKFITYKHPTKGEIKVPIDPPLRENFGGRLGMTAGAWVAGENSKIVFESVLPSADWREYIFDPEPQFFNIGDTFACTNFANCNAAKIQLFKQGIKLNFSESANAKLSGTQIGVGNYMDAAAEQTRKDGFILQADHTNGNSVAEFYRNVPLDTQKKAIKFNIAYEYVNTEFLEQELKQAPVTIMIKAGSTNHDVVALFEDENGIWCFDSYPHGTLDNYMFITTQVPLAALKIVVKKPMLNLINDNGTYFIAGDKGKIGIADPNALAKFQKLTSQSMTGSTASLPQVGVFKNVNVDKTTNISVLGND